MGNQRENFSCQIIYSVYFNGSINNFQPDLIFSMTAFLFFSSGLIPRSLLRYDSILVHSIPRSLLRGSSLQSCYDFSPLLNNLTTQTIIVIRLFNQLTNTYFLFPISYLRDAVPFFEYGITDRVVIAKTQMINNWGVLLLKCLMSRAGTFPSYRCWGGERAL